jgi:hypothetical protein
MKLEFSRQIFEKYLNVKFHENTSGESRVVPCGQTDGRTDACDEPSNRLCNFVNAPENSETNFLVTPIITNKVYHKTFHIKQIPQMRLVICKTEDGERKICVSKRTQLTK